MKTLIKIVPITNRRATGIPSSTQLAKIYAHVPAKRLLRKTLDVTKCGAVRERYTTVGGFTPEEFQAVRIAWLKKATGQI